MPDQFIRKYTLDITPRGGDTKRIEELRVVFDITRSVISTPNLAQISIYNPNQETLAALQERYTQIAFSAGYQARSGLLFEGEVRNVFQRKEGPDRIVTLFSGEGERAWQNATFNKTFSPQVTLGSVLKEIASSFDGLDIPIIEGIPDVANKLLGQSLSGASKDLMDIFAKEFGFNWSIQNNRIEVTNLANPLSTSEAVVINTLTGMLGSPTITQIEEKAIGAEVTTLLNPELFPNGIFIIDSVFSEVSLGNLNFRNVQRTSAEGQYVIQEVNYKGDSRGAEWLSLVKGRSYDA